MRSLSYDIRFSSSDAREDIHRNINSIVSHKAEKGRAQTRGFAFVISKNVSENLKKMLDK